MSVKILTLLMPFAIALREILVGKTGTAVKNERRLHNFRNFLQPVKIQFGLAFVSAVRGANGDCQRVHAGGLCKMRGPSGSV